ncbi:tagaturonate epimerase family protein [Paenibacillus sp. FA6]|uniref:tagaturonate epimerase family protein n=1 Tax=Paenibacillus sp. FA6 TaxID=3413029 RepID=UPI003F65F599
MKQIAQSLKEGRVESASPQQVKIYERSLHTHNTDHLLMLKVEGKKAIMVVGDGELFNELAGEVQDGFKLCPLSHENRIILARYFSHLSPKAFGRQSTTFGLGDRLGLAGPGHLATLRGRPVSPVLAQQSIRELALTGRTYLDVLDAASFAAFQEGFRDGYGADGDHLKEEADIQMSLDLGFTMLTLDCSEKIPSDIQDLNDLELNERYGLLSEEIRKDYEGRYLDQSFQVGEEKVFFDHKEFMKCVLIYNEAIPFMVYIYEKYIKSVDREIDFEISIDETVTPTSPEAHYFVAAELERNHVSIFSMAPRFCGEFQKGIDYIGDLEQFEKELRIHAAIADHFGFKLSIHSGSDKLSVFPVIAKYTKGRFHVKTAGTNWLEAIRTVAKENPSLYRRMHAYALEHFEEAKAYYHVTTNISRIKPLDQVSDEQLPEYMEEDNARQLLHITYGILLKAQDESGQNLFSDEFFDTLEKKEEAYEQSLKSHIGKHLDLLNV